MAKTEANKTLKPARSAFANIAVGVWALLVLLFGLASAAPAIATDGALSIPAMPAWRATPTTIVDAEERTFRNGMVTLSGTLFMPRGDGRVPVLIVLHAASSPERGSPLYRHLVQALPPMNVAVFVFDRRGSGRSGGRLEDSDYATLADDGIAALRMLSEEPRVDPSRIGFWGLSQGGWLSLLAVSRSANAAYAIAVSAPMTTPDVQMNFAVANVLRIKSYPQEDIDSAVAVRRVVDDFQRGKVDRRTAQKMLDAVTSKPWFEHVYLSRTLEDPGSSRWAREMRHDPLAVMSGVRRPALVIYGSVDPWVPVQVSIERLLALRARLPTLDVTVVAGADHTMSTSISPADQIDPAVFPRAAPDSAEYFGLLGAWLTRQGIALPTTRR
jgi:dienelactone hydrolase